MISPNKIARTSGFGMSVQSDAYVFQPTTPEEIHQTFEIARREGKRVTLRGSGRSYGDASILPEEITLDITQMNRILDWDQRTGVLEVEGGVTIEDMWRTVLPTGWWPPVVSGTMFPTVAGALAMNIHGKNNFAAGPLGEHVLELEVITPTGQTLILERDNPLTRAFISSAGLLGVITRVKFQMKHVESGMLRVLAVSQPNWDAQFEAFDQYLSPLSASESSRGEGVGGGEYSPLPGEGRGAGGEGLPRNFPKAHAQPDYFVSWVDCFAKGRAAGRGLIHAAWYDHEVEAPANYDLPPKILGLVPKSQVWRVLKPLNNRLGMRLLNTAKHVSAKLIGNNKEHHQSLVEFSFLLDYVPDWRKAYLPGGFIQYQSFVPKEHAKRVFRTQIEMQQAEGLESFLGVMKRHRPDQFMFSHAVDGFSLALDFKVTEANREKLWSLCHRMNDLVLDAGGRFYFAKDSTLRPADVTAYLGEEALDCYRQLKQRFDPENILSSALAERVGLTEVRSPLSANDRVAGRGWGVGKSGSPLAPGRGEGVGGEGLPRNHQGAGPGDEGSPAKEQTQPATPNPHPGHAP